MRVKTYFTNTFKKVLITYGPFEDNDMIQGHYNFARSCDAFRVSMSRDVPGNRCLIVVYREDGGLNDEPFAAFLNILSARLLVQINLLTQDIQQHAAERPVGGRRDPDFGWNYEEWNAEMRLLTLQRRDSRFSIQEIDRLISQLDI